MTKIYVTKYALTSGPFIVDAQVKYDGTYASWSSDGWPQSAGNKEFWLTEEEALKDCARRRDVKLKSIEKQKLKLQSMIFTFEEVQ